MYAKLCDNCNDLAAIADQECIELDLPNDTLRHFCSRDCLNTYLGRENEHELLLEEIKDKIIEILDKEKIDKLNELVNDVKDEFPSERYSNRILREELVNIR